MCESIQAQPKRRSLSNIYLRRWVTRSSLWYLCVWVWRFWSFPPRPWGRCACAPAPHLVRGVQSAIDTVKIREGIRETKLDASTKYEGYNFELQPWSNCFTLNEIHKIIKRYFIFIIMFIIVLSILMFAKYVELFRLFIKLSVRKRFVFTFRLERKHRLSFLRTWFEAKFSDWLVLKVRRCDLIVIRN